MMTTNYTHILNDNLDMFYDEQEDGYEAWEYYDDDFDTDEHDALVQATIELRKEMNEVMERCGVYGAEEWAELAALYSDAYKDAWGHRPSDIGLRYHFRWMAQ